MEVCALRDAAPDFEAVNAKVFGISTDDVAAQAAFAKAENLNYPLLADPDGVAAQAYGVLMSGRPFARRVTFVVGPDGVVRHIFRRVNVRKHGAEVAAILKELGAGGDTGLTGAVDEATFKALHELKQGEAPRLLGGMVPLGDGHGYLSTPKGEGPFPGVVLIHEWWGLNDHVKHWADRLAADGYAALAVDMYGGKVATSSDQAMELMRSVDATAGQRTMADALTFLRQDKRTRSPRIATIGWCFGGAWSLRSAIAHEDLDAAIIYYGRLQTEAAALKPIKAAVMGVFGNTDRSIPPSTVDAFEQGLKEAGVDHVIHRYDANHAFANPSSKRYDTKAAADAWRKAAAFLAKHLRQS